MTRPLRLMTIAPGHFHAALVQRDMLPGVHPKAFVYAPLDADTARHIARVAGYNTRPTNPTAWQLDVRTGPDYFARFLREQPGSVAVFAGRNKAKADQVLAAVGACVNVLVDKPWVIEADDFSKIEQAYREADLREVIVSDLMTQRHDPITILQRELMRDAEVFGLPLIGTAEQPSLTLECTHYLFKSIDGQPVFRPDWWYDVRESGEGLADVGTHLADLAMWLLFPDQPIDYRRDVLVHDATRWPTVLDSEQYQVLTGRTSFHPALVEHWVRGSVFQYFGNGTTFFTLRGVNVRLTVQWEFATTADGPEPQSVVARGTRSTVSVVPGVGNEPELTVVPAPGAFEPVADAVRRQCDEWQTDLPGVTVTEGDNCLTVTIPPAGRRSHADHFTAALREFVRYVQFPRSLPAWERPNLLAKYFLTTKAVEIARKKTDGV
jgi:predicted dehydrogenase